MFVKSLVRSEAKVLRYSEILKCVWCCGFDEKDEFKQVSSAKRQILEVRRGKQAIYVEVE